MCHCDLPRIDEIRDCVAKRGHAGHFFEHFDSSLADSPVKAKHFLHIEAELAEMDTVAWSQLKDQVVPLFEKRHRERGWQAAFDKLNQAKGYNYLARFGCVELRFIPESSVSGQKTPDLEGRLGSEIVLCEVKTINPSNDESIARREIKVRSVQFDLPMAFFCKLESTINTSNGQMDCYRGGRSSRKISYFILNFDDILHEHVERYMMQIQEFCAKADLPCVEIVFDVKPQFYSATTTSPAPSVFVWAPGGQCFKSG